MTVTGEETTLAGRRSNPGGQPSTSQQVGPVQIVGVVGHVKQWGLDSDDTNKIRNQAYFPLLQVPDKFMSSGVAVALTA